MNRHGATSSPPEPAWTTEGEATPPQRPNVLFIVFDDLSTQMGCYGDTFAKTPNFDKLAARGMVFERNYCQQPICNPSRVSFMTGRRPDTLGIWDIPTNLRERHPDMITMPQWFKQHGYFAQGIGKIYHHWAQKTSGDPASWNVPEIMHWGRHQLAHPVLPAGTPMPPTLAQDPWCECRDVPDEAYYDGRIANLAIEALRVLANKKQPFFLGVGMWKPHTPFNAPKRYWDMYDRDQVPAARPPDRPKNAPDLASHANHELMGLPPDYAPMRSIDEAAKQELRHGRYAVISYADAQIGKVLDELDRLGLAENTVVALITDHGLQVGEHGSYGKMTLYKLDTRVPLIVAGPGVTKTGTKTQSLAELIDVYPTLADLCGLPRPDGVDGVSLKPVLQDPGACVNAGALTQHPRPALYWNTQPEPSVMGYSLHTDRWCYTEWRDFRTSRVVGQELYDYYADPEESVNLAGTLEGAPHIPALAVQLEAMVRSAKPIGRPS